MAELRCYVFLDSLQPQYASFLGTVAQGFLPDAGAGVAVRRDRAGHGHHARHRRRAQGDRRASPGCSSSSASTACSRSTPTRRPTSAQAGRAILEAARPEGGGPRSSREIVASQVIRNISPYHTQLINRTRHGDMILPGQTLYVMECAPAGYAALAANEAEKAAQHQHPRGAGVRQLRPRLPGRRGARHRRRPPRRRAGDRVEVTGGASGRFGRTADRSSVDVPVRARLGRRTTKEGVT